MTQGGFTGEDLTDFARLHGLEPDVLARRVRRRLSNDARFRGINDLGKRRPNVNLDDYRFALSRFETTPDVILQNLAEELDLHREVRGLPPLPRSTMFRFLAECRVSRQPGHEPTSYFPARGIPVADGYDLPSSRSSLQSVYRLSGVTTWHGVSLTALVARLKGAEVWFSRVHPGADVDRWFPEVVARADYLPGFLATLHADERPATQAGLIFEQQVAFLVRTRDLLVDQIRLSRDRMLQRFNALLQPEVLILHREWRATLAAAGACLPANPTDEEWTQVRHLMTADDDTATVARVRIRASHLKDSARLFLALSSLTEGFSPDLMAAHVPRAQLLLDLAAGSCSWDEVAEKDRPGLGKNRRLVPLAFRAGLAEEDFVFSLLTERVLEGIRRGKITLRRSWEYQDLAPLISASHPLPNDHQLTPEGLEQLLAGTYPIDLGPLMELARDQPEESLGEGDDDGPAPRVDFTTVIDEVSALVRERNPDWFVEHQRVAAETSGGLFRMEYDEAEFARLFYGAVGMLGRNFRYRDSPDFDGMKHFARRYLTVPALDLELTFLHRTLVGETGVPARVLLTDSIGVEWRATNPMATAHGRYHTIGVADVRGVSGEMVPAACLPCPSGDTEAMHAVPLTARAYRILDGSLRIYTGNGHTTTRICAGNLLLGFGVIGAGRFIGEPRPPPLRRQEALRAHLPLLNQVGAFLRRHPGLGSVFSARSHVYVDGVNVRQMVEDVGSLVLRLVAAAEIPLHQILPRVEASNRMQRMVRIVERGGLRGYSQSLGVALATGEVVLAMSVVWLAKNRPKGTSGYPALTIGDIAFVHPA